MKIYIVRLLEEKTTFEYAAYNITGFYIQQRVI